MVDIIDNFSDLDNVCMRLRSWLTIINNEKFNNYISPMITPAANDRKYLANHIKKIYCEIINFKNISRNEIIDLDYIILLAEMDAISKSDMKKIFKIHKSAGVNCINTNIINDYMD